MRSHCRSVIAAYLYLIWAGRIIFANKNRGWIKNNSQIHSDDCAWTAIRRKIAKNNDDWESNFEIWKKVIHNVVGKSLSTSDSNLENFRCKSHISFVVIIVSLFKSLNRKSYSMGYDVSARKYTNAAFEPLFSSILLLWSLESSSVIEATHNHAYTLSHTHTDLHIYPRNTVHTRETADFMGL